jgi:hypothetical protein
LNQQPDFLPNSNHTSSSHLSNVPVSHPEDRSAMNLSHVDTVGSTEPHEEAIDWHRLLGVLKRRRKIIGFSIVGMLCLAGVYLALTPKIYQASADLLINTEQKSSGQSANALPAITDLLDATGTRSQDTEVEILRSTTVENAASLSPSMYKAAIQIWRLLMQMRFARHISCKTSKIIRRNTARQLHMSVAS